MQYSYFAYFMMGLALGGLMVGCGIYFWLRHWRNNAQRNQDQLLQTTLENTKLLAEKASADKVGEGALRELESLRGELAECQKKMGSLESDKAHLLLQLQNQNQEKEKAFQQMKEQFENLAQRIFDEKSQKFSDQNILSLKQLMDPFKLQIKDFEKRIEETYSNERVERGTLKGEINRLIELNVRMSSETENLTRALKGDVKIQGNWGEFVLESILERSGLREGEEYLLQGQGLNLKSDESGNALRPDVLVKLPDDKFLVVDSKMTLKAFEAYINSDNPEEQERLAKDHVESLKKHIDGLAEKKYHDLNELGSPDLTLLFMPLEPAFALAFRIKPELLQMAWEKQVAIVSPTTLLTTLRTVASLWKQQRQNKNTLEIAKAGGALYDKFLGLLEGIEQMGLRLKQSQEAYDDVLLRMSQGKGNLLKQVERLKELGAKTEKSIESKNLGRQLLTEGET